VATTSAIEILKTPYHAKRPNAICERFLRRVRQECLDHVLVFREKQLQRVLNQYVAYFNRARPHQGIQQQIPEPSKSSLSSHQAGNKVIALPIFGAYPNNQFLCMLQVLSRHIHLLCFLSRKLLLPTLSHNEACLMTGLSCQFARR
jgi:hypothetical protein